MVVVLAFIVAAASLVALSSALLLIFYLIFCITDNHLVPTIEVFIQQFQIPETVAAVTLVAFGSATPELLLQSVAAIENTNDISLSAILGSAMIAFGLIPPMCLLSTSHVELRLLAWPVIRETGFYILGLSVFLFAIIDGVVTTEEALMMSAVYVAYVGTVVGAYMMTYQGARDDDADADAADASGGLAASVTQLALTSPLRDVATPKLSGAGAGAGAGAVVDPATGLLEDVEAVVPAPESAMASLTDLLQRYVCNLLEATVRLAVPALDVPHTSRTAADGYTGAESRLLMDDDDDEAAATAAGGGRASVSLFRAVWCLATCICYVGGLAAVIVALCHRISHLIGVGGSTVGATLVALGSEIPDAISSISLAKKGYINGAMSGAIGSQVINISLGVGLPALFVCVSGNGLFFVDQTDSVWLLSSLAFVVILMHVAMTIPVWSLVRGLLVKHAAITKSGALMQVATWCAVYVAFCLLNEWNKDADGGNAVGEAVAAARGGAT